jgi:hypothetical protein
MDKITYKSSSPSQHTPQSQHIVMESETTETEVTDTRIQPPLNLQDDKLGLEENNNNIEVVGTRQGLPRPDDTSELMVFQSKNQTTDKLTG